VGLAWYDGWYEGWRLELGFFLGWLLVSPCACSVILLFMVMVGCFLWLLFSWYLGYGSLLSYAFVVDYRLCLD